MKKNGLILMVALVLSMMLAGCSKSESEDIMEIKGKSNVETEQMLADMKQHIVGTWIRDGWVRETRDFYELKGNINNGVIDNVNAVFEESIEDIFVFQKDGKVLHKLADSDDVVSGLYEIKVDPLFCAEFGHIFATHIVFMYQYFIFSTDYNTLYLDAGYYIMRYRRTEKSF